MPSSYYYRLNHEKYKADARRDHKNRNDRIRRWLDSYLKSHPCVDCGERDPIVLQFDHLRDKLFTIGEVARRSLSLRRVIAEVEKCEVRCANCHFRKHHAQRVNNEDVSPPETLPLFDGQMT